MFIPQMELFFKNSILVAIAFTVVIPIFLKAVAVFSPSLGMLITTPSSHNIPSFGRRLETHGESPF